jgi:hypothetical protein
VIVGSYLGGGGGLAQAGKAHVVYGKSTFAPVLLSDVEDGVGGFHASGVDNYDNLGTSVSGAGDFDGDGLDDVIIGAPQVYISPNSDVGQSYVLFNPGVSTPLVIELRDADTGDAIPSGIVIAEWDEIPCGFVVEMASIDGQGRSIYMSGQTKIGDYRLRATAPGYFPADIVLVTPDTSDDPVATIELTKDTGLTETNVIRVEINMLDGAGGTPTGELLLSETLALRQNEIELEIPAIFGVGEIIFHGVPSGTFEVYHDDTADHEFTTIDVTVGTGEDKSTAITASLVARPALTRDSVPGNIVGSVSNTGPSSPVALPDAVVYSTQTNLGIFTITLSKANGTYFFPSIVEGTGTLQAFSSDGLTEGGKKPSVIVSGQTFGDDESEESDLSVTINAGQNDPNDPNLDSDFDGLTDIFEANFLSGAPINERGPADDPDDDGLTNLEEQNANTHPMLQDTDSDTYHDGIELNWGSDPTNQASTPTAPNPVWVDFGYAGKMNAGTLGKPFTSLQDAIDHAPNDATIRIKGDVSTTIGANPDQPITIPITIESFRGTITIQ